MPVTHEDERSTWDQLPDSVAFALSTVLDNREMPAQALGLYARWWQLEAWLRSLAYVELRARDGLDWANSLDTQSQNRRMKDQQYEYMASPDWQDPLAYLDASRLLQLIDVNWELFETVLPARPAWIGRQPELLGIRNRIGHLRRPHRDDQHRLEQTLRDLEYGAFRAVTSYNRWLDTSHLDQTDPVIAGWIHEEEPDAERLVQHARRQYDVTFRLSYSVRPWAEHPQRGAPATGCPGILWHVAFYTGLRVFNVRQLWRDLSPLTRQLVVHLLVPDSGHIHASFPAIDDSALVIAAIGDLFDSILRCSRRMREEEIMTDNDDWDRGLMSLDSRVQVKTAWSFVDESMVPISFFGAG